MTNSEPFLDTRYRATIDERVMALVEEKRPIGQSKNAYINFLVQRALSSEPARIIPREVNG
tara:strand:+ start:664 stop:846 length:183 start_codon:yes stop_codon:yes gene_type:complete